MTMTRLFRGCQLSWAPESSVGKRISSLPSPLSHHTPQLNLFAVLFAFVLRALVCCCLCGLPCFLEPLSDNGRACSEPAEPDRQFGPSFSPLLSCNTTVSMSGVTRWDCPTCFTKPRHALVSNKICLRILPKVIPCHYRNNSSRDGSVAWRRQRVKGLHICA